MLASAFEHGAKNLVCVCVDKAVGCSFAGRLYHRYSCEPEIFRETDYLLLRMDALFDRLNYPQRDVLVRSFRPKRRRDTEKEFEEKNMADNQQEFVNDPSEQKGDIATFVIHVMYRQNATWQGNVLWAESGQTQNFRSALELIRLMDSAVDEDRGNGGEQKKVSE